MAAMLGPLEAGGDQRRYFHATYQRTTIAVADELRRGGFADTEWVEARRASAVATGAMTSWAAPVTIMISPIASAS